MSQTVTKLFDLSELGDAAVRAIVDGLQVDREHVLGVNHNPGSGVLEVALAGAGAAGHVEDFIAGMRRTHKVIGRKVLKATRANSLAVRDIDADLVSSRDVLRLGDGLIGLRGPLLDLFRFFEREFRELARAFDAEEHHYPAMVPVEVLSEVGYFDHFPQHVTFCSHLRGSLPLLEAAAHEASASRDGLPDSFQKKLTSPGHVLIPAVCLPCYRHQRGTMLESGRVRTLTMQNHVYRYEGAGFRPLARAWDFTVRDIVFFGRHDDLVRLRSEVIDRTLELCRALDLEVSIELANDPFFLDTSREKAVYQRMGEVKYELLFPLPPHGGELAASSFNLHRDFYTAVYDVRQEGIGLAESACMGFGLERWVYGFLIQKGLDPRDWPDRVASRLG